MDKGFDSQHPELSPQRIPQIANAMFQAVGAQGPDKAIKGIQLAKSLLEEEHPDLPEADRPVLGLGLLSHFSVSDEQKEALFKMINTARQDPKSVTSGVIQRLRVMHQGVDDYFRSETTPFDYIQFSQMPDQVAMSLITLEAHKLAADTNKQLKEDQKGGVVTPFIDPESGEPGLWMSAEGIPYDPDKLRKRSST
jgi:hypothetical protein